MGQRWTESIKENQRANLMVARMRAAQSGAMDSFSVSKGDSFAFIL